MKQYMLYQWIFPMAILLIATNLYGQAPPSSNALFGNLKARQLGPALMSGRVSDLDVVESSPQVIYIGAAGGGVWKSNNGGATFRSIFDEHIQSIGHIAIDQLHPDTVWVGTGEPWVRNSVASGNGIYKSTDGGSTWQHKGLSESGHISNIIVHPTSPDTVYVAVQGKLWKESEERGVYATFNGGKSWEKILYVNPKTGAADLTIDPENPDVLYATLWEHRRYPHFFISGGKGSGLYKSEDGGKSWNKIHNGLPKGDLGRMAVAVAPSNSNKVYLTVEAEKQEDKGLYVSEDAGESWKMINGQFGTYVRPFYFSRIVVDPNDEDKIYKCGLKLIVSDDGGATFRTVQSGVHADSHAVWINPKNSKHVIIGTDGGAYRSLDGGYAFEMFMGLPISQFYHVSVDMDDPYHVYGGLQDNGSWSAPTKKRDGIGNYDWERSYVGDGFYSFRHPTDKDIIYSEAQGGQLVRYNRATNIVQNIKPYTHKGEEKLRFNWNAPIHISKNNPERLYFGAQYLLMSENRGNSWQRLSPDLTTNDPSKQQQEESGYLSIDNSGAENHTTIYAINESTIDENIVWVGTDDGNLQVTSDFGGSWENVGKNIPGLPDSTWVAYIESGHHSQNTAYVAFDDHRRGNRSLYIYRTNDLGQTWEPLGADNVEGYALSVREDLENPNLLFLGTSMGLYVSVDKGGSWSRFKENVPKVAIRDMVIHPREPALVMATHGRGIIIIDDITPLRQLNPEVYDKTIHFFEMPPTYLESAAILGGRASTGANNFMAPNPNDNVRIAYYQKRRHTFGKMYLEVYDPKGNKVQELPAGKSGGINIVNMPVRMERPKAAPTSNRFAGNASIFGPNLPLGTYTVKLIKGSQEFETTFQLKPNPKLGISAEEMETQRRLSVELYRLIEKSAYYHYVLSTLKSEASRLSKQNSSQMLKKRLARLQKIATDLKEELIAHGGDGYVNEPEKLNEQIGLLYASVARYPGSPSESQVKRKERFKEELDQFSEKVMVLVDKDLAQLNKELEKNKVKPIEILTEKKYLER